MAFKRSAVRSRVAPPLIRLKKHYVYLNAANKKAVRKGGFLICVSSENGCFRVVVAVSAFAFAEFPSSPFSTLTSFVSRSLNRSLSRYWEYGQLFLIFMV